MCEINVSMHWSLFLCRSMRPLTICILINNMWWMQIYMPICDSYATINGVEMIYS